MRAPSSQALRTALQLDRNEWARILGVSTATVLRWEAHDHSPTGLALAVLHGIDQAITKAGADRVRNRIILGVGHLLYSGLTDPSTTIRRSRS